MACFDNMGKLLACLFVRQNNQNMSMSKKDEMGAGQGAGASG